MINERNIKTMAVIGLAVAAASAGCSRRSSAYDLATAAHAVPADRVTAQATAPDEVMAKVDGESVTRGDVNKAIDIMFGSRLRALPTAQRDAIRAQLTGEALEGVIEKTLVMRAVDREAIAVGTDEVDASLEQMMARLPPDEKLDDFLNDSGISESELRVEVVRSLKLQKWIEILTADVPEPTAAEIEATYDASVEQFTVPEKVAVRHVLIGLEPDDDAEAAAAKKSRAEKVRQDLLDGESFEETAKAVSDCPSRDQGGNIGPFARGAIVPRLEEAAFSQDIGEIGPVVETRFGYHVIQVQERTEEKVMTLAEVEVAIADQLRSEKERLVVTNAIGELKKAATITYANATGTQDPTTANGPA